MLDVMKNERIIHVLARHADMDLDKIISRLMNLRRDETRVEK